MQGRSLKNQAHLVNHSWHGASDHRVVGDDEADGALSGSSSEAKAVALIAQVGRCWEKNTAVKLMQSSLTWLCTVPSYLSRT